MNVFRNHKNRAFSPAALITIAVLIALGLIGSPQGRAQSPPQNIPAIKFEYEVASIKPSNPDAPGGFMTIPGPGSVSDTFTARNFTPIMLLRAAYGIPLGSEDSRITGAPSSLKSEKYDVDAKIDSSVLDELKKLTPEQRALAQQQMLQALLADRFKLTIHRETKDLPMYTLVVVKNGPKFQESKLEENSDVAARGPGRGGRGIAMTGRGGPLVAQSVPIANLTNVLSMLVGRPVLDKTGLTGKYDFKLQWTPDESQGGPNFPSLPPGVSPPPPPDPNGPSLFTALQEQLGLKLESGKGPVEIIVIDHIERPSGN